MYPSILPSNLAVVTLPSNYQNVNCALNIKPFVSNGLGQQVQRAPQRGPSCYFECLSQYKREFKVYMWRGKTIQGSDAMISRVDGAHFWEDQRHNFWNSSPLHSSPMCFYVLKQLVLVSRLGLGLWLKNWSSDALNSSSEIGIVFLSKQ